MGLARDNRAASWALNYLNDDVLELFTPNRLPVIPAQVRSRTIEIRVSAHMLSVTTYRKDDNSQLHEVGEEMTRPQRPMIVGRPEWDELERLAIDAAKRSVEDLRLMFTDDPMEQMTKFKGKVDRDRERQIEGLAYRLTGRFSENKPHIDRAWCKRLAIDPPPKP